MQVLDLILADARRLYEQVSGAPYERTQLRGRPLAVPKDSDAEAFLYQQVAHLRNLLAAHTSPFWSNTPQWMPVLDAYEIDGRMVLRLELPGLQRADVALSVGENLVVVKGEREFRAEPGATVLAKERFYGPFERWVPLPFRVKAEVADARFQDGVLEVRLERSEPTADGARKVEIRP